MATLIELTPSLQQGIGVINKMDSEKFSVILNRIVQRIHLKNSTPFNSEELEKLETVLKVNKEEMTEAIITCAYLFQQAAHYAVKPKIFAGQLIKAEMNQDKAESFMKVWEKNHEQVNVRLQDQSIAPLQFASLDWQLHLNIAHQNVTHQKNTTAIFNLNYNDHLNQNETKLDSLQVEFTYEQLAQFFGQLETIQEQLDTVQK